MFIEVKYKKTVCLLNLMRNYLQNIILQKKSLTSAYLHLLQVSYELCTSTTLYDNKVRTKSQKPPIF